MRSHAASTLVWLTRLKDNALEAVAGLPVAQQVHPMCKQIATAACRFPARVLSANMPSSLTSCFAVARVSLRPGETPEQAQERRLRESQQVEERVVYVSDMDDWDRETRAAGKDLVVVEVKGKVTQQQMHQQQDMVEVPRQGS